MDVEPADMWYRRDSWTQCGSQPVVLGHSKTQSGHLLVGGQTRPADSSSFGKQEGGGRREGKGVRGMRNEWVRCLCTLWKDMVHCIHLLLLI